MSRHKLEAEPETRVGHCCGAGCQQLALLFKVPGIFRYRCATCFEKETGRRHHLDFRIACADCGRDGERTGHQDCQYPQDHR